MGSAPAIQRVLILGDNRLSASIINGLAHHTLDLHHAFHPRSDVHSHHASLHDTDFSSDSLINLFQTIRPDLIFSTYSSSSFDFQKQIIDLAISFGVPRFVPAEFGQDSINQSIQEKLPPCKERARVIEYLKQKSSEGGIQWVATATGCVLDRGLISGNIGFEMKWQSATVHGTGEERLAASSSAWHGRVAYAIVQHWDEFKNQYLYLPGMITSANEILSALQSVTNQKWERGEVEIEEIVREAEKRIERGWPDAGMFLLERAVLFDEGLGAVKPFLDNDGKAGSGLEMEDVMEVVRDAVREFGKNGKGDCGCG